MIAVCIAGPGYAAAAPAAQTPADACSNLNLIGAAETACEHGFTAQKAGTTQDSACTSSKYPNNDNLSACQQGWDIANGSDPSIDCTSSNCNLLKKYINPLINALSIAFGFIVVISLIMGAIQFSASEGDPQKAAQAKKRIANTLVAFFVYSLMYGFLQFLIPGGLFH